MLTIILNTFREAIAKKIFIGYYVIYTLIIIIFLFAINLDVVEGVMSLTDVQQSVISFEAIMTTVSYLLVLIFCIISAATFIPSLIEKGTIDLILSKPLSRASILLSKYTGAVVFVAISLIYFIGTIWLILSLKSGYWNFSFLFTILSLTISFAVMYSIVVLIILTTQSSIIAILVNLFLIFVILPLLASRETAIFTFVTNDTARFFFNFFYYILPKPNQINDITIKLVTHQDVSTWQPLLTSLLFCGAVLGFDVYYFSRKDY